MLLKDYLSEITVIINELTETGLIIFYDVTADMRTEKIGLIKGIVEFIDGSKLFFTEYVDLRFKIEKESYSFHYQNKDSNLIFRYDNAAHKPKLEFKGHKHINDQIFQANIPNLCDVLEEIINDYLTA